MNGTKAQRRQLIRIAVFLPTYFAAFWFALRYVRQHHPQGLMLYLWAALPWLTMCGLIATSAAYLYEERDGYSRELAMRSMLWGAAGAMATNLFVMFLQMFGWRGQAPVYLEICVFAACTMVARISYEAANRTPCGPEEMER